MDETLLDRHSTDVRLVLTIAGTRHEVAQVGPDYLIFREPVDLPPCEGVLSIEVDGVERRRTIRLEDGAKSTDRLTATAAM